jgi:predicted transposase/invertase (TIGR01784 family)
MGETRFDLLKMPEAQRRFYERYQHDLHYQASMVESSYTIGLRKGRKKGKEEGKREIAVNLLASGSLDIGAIAEITGLSVEELQGLKQGDGLIK